MPMNSGSSDFSNYIRERMLTTWVRSDSMRRYERIVWTAISRGCELTLLVRGGGQYIPYFWPPIKQINGYSASIRDEVESMTDPGFCPKLV